MVLEGRGEQSLTGVTITADRGYAKQEVLCMLSNKGLISMFVMPEHLLRCHPFVGSSFLMPAREDDNEQPFGDDFEADTVPPSPSAGSGGIPTQSEATRLNEQEAAVLSQNASSQGEEPCAGLPLMRHAGVCEEYLDRRKTFIIDDAPSTGPAVFSASKRLDGTRSYMSAVAVRKRGTEKFAKILRFLFDVPQVMGKQLNAWIAVPKLERYEQYLFSGLASGSLSASMSTKRIIEDAIAQKCSVLSIGQRCAD